MTSKIDGGLTRRVCLFLASVLFASTAVADQLVVASANVESGDANPAWIVREFIEKIDAYIWGFSEVQSAEWADAFEGAAENAYRRGYEGILGTTGGSDRLLILYDEDLLEHVETIELHEVNIGGNVRAPLVARFRLGGSPYEFLFMVNHLHESDATARHQQASMLNKWAKEQNAPVIAVGVYSFDWKLPDRKNDHDPGFDNMTRDGVLTWVRPAALVKTHCSPSSDSVRDFVFVSGQATRWKATSEILHRDTAFCIDDNQKPDHRPVTATIPIEAVIARDPLADVYNHLALEGPLHSSGWVPLEGRPSPGELACTGYSGLFWGVSVKDGVLHVTHTPSYEQMDHVPFQIAAAPDRDGYRYVVSVPDGFLVGFNNGEFGGGLWWFNRQGTESRRIPAPAAGLHAEYQPENVVGLPIVAGEQFVLMGLDHLTSRRGRIFRAVPARTGWTLAPVATLDSKPDVWLVDDNRLLFLTGSGLWSTDPRGNTNRIHETDLDAFAATSSVRAPDGALYFGLRHYVVRLQASNGRWRETWYRPAGCRKVEMRLGQCVCTG